jgi:hypothetical protein
VETRENLIFSWWKKRFVKEVGGGCEIGNCSKCERGLLICRTGVISRAEREPEVVAVAPHKGAGEVMRPASA